MESRWRPTVWHLFNACFRLFMKRRLAGIYLAGLPENLPERTSVIMVANHVSWWDGFLLREVHRRCVRRAPLYTMMLEEQLRRFPLFRWMGVFGIEPGALGSLRKAVLFIQDRQRHEGVLWLSFFPQGRIWPSWRRPLGFQPGLRLFARVLQPVVLLPVGLHLESLNRPSPSAFVWVGTPLVFAGGAAGVEEAEQQVALALDAIFDLLQAHGEAMPSHWPGVRIL